MVERRRIRTLPPQVVNCPHMYLTLAVVKLLMDRYHFSVVCIRRMTPVQVCTLLSTYSVSWLYDPDPRKLKYLIDC